MKIILEFDDAKDIGVYSENAAENAIKAINGHVYASLLSEISDIFRYKDAEWHFGDNINDSHYDAIDYLHGKFKDIMGDHLDEIDR